MIKIYNTMTRQKEEFIPIQEGKVGMYVCGPTVYNYIHIGNARSTIAFDLIRRYFEHRGYEVNFVSNFTDVDDKIIRRANEENLSTEEIAEKYIQAFLEDTKALHVLPANKTPRAVECMGDIVDFIENLVEKEMAYVVDGDVFFRATKSKDYGRLANKSIEDLEIGASGRVGEEAAKKENPVDFAVWKRAKEGEPSWSSPWGEGRPGWHIECSVMATKFVGETLDIHGGGSDLEFPHHTNEIAQSEAKTGKKFANYWMHNGFVTVGEEDEKMSKSLGNFVTARDLLSEVDGMLIHFFMASAHYRRPIRFSEQALEEARVNLEKLKNTKEFIDFRLKDAVDTESDRTVGLQRLSDFENEFTTAMDDDFNAANGLTVLYEFSTWINKVASGDNISKEVLEQARKQFESWLSVFGVSFETEIVDEEIETLIEERNQARSEKNFARADEIRDELKEKGITLLDTPQGTRWKKE